MNRIASAMRAGRMGLSGLACAALVFFGWSGTAAADSATASPGSCISAGGIGTVAWSIPGNAVSSNNIDTTASLNDGMVSNYLRCVDYGFAIPAGSIINGITVSVERASSNSNTHQDAAMRLIKAGTIGTTDRSTATFYPTADAVEAHGGANDLWGTTWTPADINDAAFGAAFAAWKSVTSGGSRTVSVDHVRITVDYTPPPSASAITRGSANPAEIGTTVTWSVVFSSNVNGVDTADFALVPAGGATGASILSVTGSGAAYTVTANVGSATGTLGLNLVDNDSIVDAATGVPLGGAGAGNGNVTGQIYSVVPPFCSPPSNIPAGLTLTCVCDTFNRATLNPSPIFGANWAVSNSEGAGGTNPYINTGTNLLRLTESTGYNAKAATAPGIYPAAGNYISVEFNHYAYNGSGADGIAVTLSDYSVPAVPGGFGGSLGYAQRNDGAQPPGFAGGWLGVALDEYGNYQNPTEGRVLGPGFRVQSIGLRGPGNGANGYRWIGGTGSSPGGLSIDNRASATPAPGYKYQVIVDARNYASGSINVSVNRDATARDGSAYAGLFGPFNAYGEANYALGQGWISKLVPDYWQISFTGSTGGSDNIHEIGALRICAQTVYPPSGGAASGFSVIDEAYPAAPSSTVPAYQNFQTGHIYMKLPGAANPFRLWVAALTSSGISTAYSAISNKHVRLNLVDNSDNVCGPDSARTCNAACTGKAAVEGATQVVSYTASDPGAKLSAPITLNSAWKNLIAIVKECTDSTCSAYTATPAACSADSFSVRPTGVTSVVSAPGADCTSQAANNPSATGGTPVVRAGTNFCLKATTSGIAGSASGYTGVLKVNPVALLPVSPAVVKGTVTGTFPAAISATGASTAAGSSFTYSEVGGFLLQGFNPAANATATAPRGVFDGVDTASECAGLTAGQCDALRLATWTGVDSISSKADCISGSFTNTKNIAGSFATNVNFGKYGCNFGLGADATFGRFIPNEFALTGVQLIARPVACPAPVTPTGYSYFDEPMQLSLTLEARNAGGDITRNYGGDPATNPNALAKLNLSASGAALNIAAIQPTGAMKLTSFPDANAAVTVTTFADLTTPGRVSTTGLTGVWPAPGATAGRLSLTGTVTVSSLNNATNNRVAPDGPYLAVNIGIRPQDSDGVRIATYDLSLDDNNTMEARIVGSPMALGFGMLRLNPAVGSERLPLTMTADMLAYNGLAFVPNTRDSCTQLPLTRLILDPASWKKNLNSPETYVVNSRGSTAPVTAANMLGFKDGSGNPVGKGQIWMRSPGAGNEGSVVVRADLAGAGLAYLRGKWGGAATRYDIDPFATATFGLYKGVKEIIYLREVY